MSMQTAAGTGTRAISPYHPTVSTGGESSIINHFSMVKEKQREKETNESGEKKKRMKIEVRIKKARLEATRYRYEFFGGADTYISPQVWHYSARDRNLLLPPPEVNPKMTWSPHLQAILEGVHDPNSPLSLLRGHQFVLKKIYQIHVDSWKDALELTKASATHNFYDSHFPVTIAFAPIARVVFPTPNGRRVNMLPFVLGDEESLPESVREYHDLIMSCPLENSEIGKVLYLTVEEGLVEAGETQRRGGLHIESPRYSKLSKDPCYLQRDGWGEGVYRADKFQGGLYMASTVSDTCRVYHALVDKAAVDFHGGLDYLAPSIPDSQGYNMQANELIWMTDRTPHKVLPQSTRAHRQFFRLVTSSLSIWHAAHNTPNPKVPLPNHVLVVEENRFSK